MEYSIVGPWMAMFVVLVIKAVRTRVKSGKMLKGFGWAMFWLVAGAVVVLVDDSLVCFLGALFSFILMKESPRSMNGKVNPVWGIMIGFNFVALAINWLIALKCGGEGFALFLNWMVALPTMYMVAFYQD